MLPNWVILKFLQRGTEGTVELALGQTNLLLAAHERCTAWSPRQNVALTPWDLHPASHRAPAARPVKRGPDSQQSLKGVGGG